MSTLTGGKLTGQQYNMLRKNTAQAICQNVFVWSHSTSLFCRKKMLSNYLKSKFLMRFKI